MSNKTITLQSIIGVTQDGIWGPKSQAVLIASGDDVKKDIQRVLGLNEDGVWSTDCQDALNSVVLDPEEFSCDASSFADSADVREFKRRKAMGYSDLEAFKYGDNGIGQFGKVTAQDTIPMVAVHSRAMRARWGSVAAAAHRPVRVTVNGKTIDATVEDRISELRRIDLNPACAKQLGLNPPFVVPCSWRWV